MKYEQIAKALINEGRDELRIYRSFGLWSEFSIIRSLVKEGKAVIVAVSYTHLTLPTT